MFRITAVRRFQTAAPRFQPPVSSSSVQSSFSSVNTLKASSKQGRVAMMPGSDVKGVQQVSQQQGSVAPDMSAADAYSTLASQDDILSVGTVSIQGHGQKVSTVA